ncbi:uncharacterized protein [Oryza sativa Japonica Group]|uniref:Os02g0251900 protein n=6 Tax=Oryza TaxID=4527 RepID=A3A544_ORYSJ|nr:uncharacterized protein LOC4328899 [Oryza sativa Japonica Group]XP_052145118.1 uncharacterized protein LOC127764299 [Oryza glaberrima]EAY85219.1 hypothetical protein OsI_06589 [Oryza sativa Indica Group]KAB8086676.1 hypothetical protein EE612_010133 [Oryza sativa]EAZ22433.1 hypothetical protein OsJ_06102 [Oryza sativa Japonica Group]KAF2944030.1 hypothetical protein DAI22_02g109700 [Oryza sativa Japonica Group]BAD19166.1 unknown protein [Oryza sativa Japonica Group]|eukprot:NP_001046447.1 Os02g0251900 [Oryza sativa Japonica Group]
MERGCNGNGGGGGGVKVTFIETQFVTSDAAGFKSLVQRLTGNDAAVPAAPPQRPRPCRADGWRGAGGASATVVKREAVPPPVAPWVDEMMMLYETCDLAEMLRVDVVGASGGGRCHGGGGYGGFPC